MLLGVDPNEQLALGDWQGGDDKLQKADLSAMPARYSASRYKFSVRVKLTVIHVFKSLWLRFGPQTWDAIPERAFALAKDENEEAIASAVDADSHTGGPPLSGLRARPGTFSSGRWFCPSGRAFPS